MDTNDTDQQPADQHGTTTPAADGSNEVSPSPRTADIHDDAQTIDFTVSQTQQFPSANGITLPAGDALTMLRRLVFTPPEVVERESHVTFTYPCPCIS